MARSVKPRPTLSAARAQYTHRFTEEHVPAWARKICINGKFYAPQYSTDAEWYSCTEFPGQPGGSIDGRGAYCESSRQSWPLGQWLESPYYSPR